MKYENRLVLFLDILGFQKIIDDTKNDNAKSKSNIERIYTAINNMRSFFEKITLGSSKQVTQFSDTIVLSVKIDDPNSIRRIFPNILQLVFILLNNNLLCRGALAFGKLYHDENIIFGPALNEAHSIESRAAIYPRVIIDKSIFAILPSNFPAGIESDRFRVTLCDPIFNIDTDNRYYLDYFTGVLADFNYKALVIKDYLLNLRQIIIDGLSIDKTEIKIKYEWMKNKYNSFIDQLPNYITENDINSPDIIELEKERNIRYGYLINCASLSNTLYR